jgi:glycosyltransferase involved in cell wall biosynthesis
MNHLPPFLIVTIDTECDKSANWRTATPLSFKGVTHAIPSRLQPLFARTGVRPTYLLSPEVITDPESCDVLRSLQGVELTSHLHGDYVTPQIKTWNFAGTITDEMQWEYPPELERAKLATLTELFEQQFGRRPTSFRAGRFGISAHTGRWLRELGYLVDSSVTPHICWTGRNGEKRPDFRNFPERPYTVAPDGNIWTPGKSDFLEVPVTVLAPGTVPANKPRDPIWFRPWYSDAETLCDVLRHVAEEKAADGLHRPLVMMFHNVELIAGASPYPQTEAEVERYLQMLERVFALAVKLGIKFCTLTEYYRHYMAGLASNSAPALSDSARPQTVSEFSSPCAPEVNLPVALVEAALTRHGVHAWFNYAFRQRAERWDCWRPCEWVVRHFPKDAPVLSLGAGVGYNLFWLAQHGFTDLHGLDIDAGAIAAGQDIAREAGLPVRLWVDEALKPAWLPAKKFAVIEALVWVCLTDEFPLEELLDRYLPHLAAGGVFIVDIIDAAYNLLPDNQYHTQDRGKPVAERRPSEYKHRFSEAQIRQIFESKGMTVAAVIRESASTPKAVYVASQQTAVTHLIQPSVQSGLCAVARGLRLRQSAKDSLASQAATKTDAVAIPAASSTAVAGRTRKEHRVFPALPSGGARKNPRRLRVCIASPEFLGLHQNGGIGTAYTTMAEVLVKAGHDVTCLYLGEKAVASHDIEHWVKDFKRRGMVLAPLPRIKDLGLHYSECYVKAYEVYHWLKNNDHFDVVHFQEWQGFGYFAIAAKRQGLAFARTTFCVGLRGGTDWLKAASREHVADLSDLGLDFMERQSVAMSDMAFCPSQFLLNWVLDRGWELPAASYVQQSILPHSARSEKKPLSDQLQDITELVFFGRLQTLKGLALFCDALDRLPDAVGKKIQRVSFLGKESSVDGVPARAYITQRSKQWPWKSEIISDRNQPQAMEYLSRPGRLAIVASLLENSPNAICECLGLGVPFVASRVGGIPELIAPADVDRVCFDAKPEALAAKLSAALTQGFRAARPSVDPCANEQSWIAWHESLIPGPAHENNAVPAIPSSLPKVSVCLTTFDRPNLLRQAVASLETQDYSNFEVVLVDDGSTQPAAVEALQELEPAFARRGWKIVRQQNRYLGAARNTAVRNATGEFLLFMDDDNFAEPAELSTLVKAALHSHADILTCGSNSFSGFEAPNRQAAPRSRNLPLGGSVAYGAFRNCFGDANALVRRSCFERLGGFAELHGVTHEDWEFFARAVLQGFKLMVLPEFLFWYRVNPNSMLRTTNLYRNRMLNIGPYLDAVPEALRGLVLFAQGQQLRLEQLAKQGLLDPSAVRMMVAWRCKMETAKVLVRQKQIEAAIRLLIEAVKSVEGCQHPQVALEALLMVGKEMCALDRARAVTLLKLGLNLAKAIPDEAAERTACKLLASMSSAPAPAATPAVRESAAPKPEPPLVSVVIPCYKQAHFLAEAVESVVTQTFTDWEIVIVNDGSPDDTSEVAKRLIAKHPGKQIHLLEKSNSGLPGARNAGMRAASGKYLLPLDADDKIKPTLLAKLVPILDNRPKVGFAYSHIQHFGEIDTEFPLPDFDRATLIAKDNIACVCALVRRSAWEQVGGYNEAMREGYEDWDFWIGCVEHGWDGYCLHEPLFLYRKSGRTMLSDANQKRERLIAQIVQNHPKLYSETPRQSATDILARHAATQAAEVAKAAAPSTDAAASLSGQPGRPRLRITYLISSILGVTGGNQTLLRQAEEMRRRGHDVTIVTYTGRPDWFQFQTRVIQAPAGQPLSASVPPSDIVVATYFTNAPELIAIKAPVKIYYAQGDQYVFADATMADTQQNRQCRELSRASYRLPGIRFVPNSRNLADAVQKLCGRRPDAILPVCTDQTIFRPLQRSLPGSKFRLLIVGPDTRGTEAEPLLFKGIQDIHDALQILARKYPHFTAVRMSAVAPDIFARFPCEFYIAPGDEMKTVLFGTSHIHIYASHYDSCPRPPQEAMAAGCAVVCTATSGAMEYCRDGENALLVPVKSPQAIADAVERLIRDHALREKLVQGGLATAREFPREREWNEWETILFRFIDEAAKPAAVAAAAAKPVKSASPIKLPPCALVGHLGEARDLLKKKNLQAAWESACAAIQTRPFHPEACLFLGKAAQAAGDSDSARRCGQHAAKLAPHWKPAKQFLKANPRGNGRPGRLILPPAITEKADSAPRLSVCLIVKNEEQFLGQCLQSVRDIAHQIVVVDTGSTDQTIEIAKKFNAEVHFFAWNDDFSAARNEALKYVTGDWVLSLDADEELMPEHRHTILEEMQSTGVMGYRLPIIDQGLEQEGCSYVPRLFRNAPGLFFVGRVHEQIFSSLEVRAKEWGLENRLGRTALLHHGYRKEVVDSRGKAARNLRLLQLAIEELPGEPNLVMNLGLELIRSGQLEAGLEQYREALRLMSVLPSRQVAPELRETLLTQLTTHLLGAGRFSEIVELWRQPFTQSAGLTASQHFMLGLAQMELKQPAASAEQMRQCLAKRRQPALSSINKEILKAGPRHCLALSLAALGEQAGAEQAFRDALGEDAKSRPVRFDFAKFQFHQGRPLEALKLVNELVAESCQDIQAWQLGGQIALSQPEFLQFAHDWTGEAIKHFPEDSAILLQRAEALTLNQQVALALPLWTKAHFPNSARHLAALTLCEVLAGDCQRHFTPHAEKLVSQEFLKWYRHLIQCKAHTLVNQVNEKLGDLQAVLPAAVGVLGAAMKQAEAAMAV